MLPQFIFYFLAINVMAFAVFGWDKFCAIRQIYRVPERTLLMLALIGGALGAKIAQRIFRHKTHKEPFRTWLNVILALNIVGLFAFAVPEIRMTILRVLMR